MPSPDAWGPARAAEAIERGGKVYHAVAQCSSCHPAYESRQVIDQASRELNGGRAASFRTDLYAAEAKDSDYFDGLPLEPTVERPTVEACGSGCWRPIFCSIRCARFGIFDDPVSASADLYRVIAAGVGGTAMPQWQGRCPKPTSGLSSITCARWPCCATPPARPICGRSCWRSRDESGGWGGSARERVLAAQCRAGASCSARLFLGREAAHEANGSDRCFRCHPRLLGLQLR